MLHYDYQHPIALEEGMIHYEYQHPIALEEGMLHSCLPTLYRLEDNQRDEFRLAHAWE